MKTLLKVFYSHYSKINSGDWPWIRTQASLYVSLIIVILFPLSVLKFGGINISLDSVFKHKIVLILLVFGSFYIFDYFFPESAIKEYQIKNQTLEKRGFLIVLTVLAILFVLSSLLLLKSAGKI